MLGKRNTRNSSQGKKEESSNKAQKTENQTDVVYKTRPEKTDFAPLYKKHKEIMESKECGLKMEEMINFRKEIHKHPEGGFKEF